MQNIMTTILEGAVYQPIPSSSANCTSSLPPIPIEPSFFGVPLIDVVFLAFVILALAAVLFDYYEDAHPERLEGKLIIRGGKMYRVRLHEIELREKQA